MALFTAFTRRRSSDGERERERTPERELPDEVRRRLPRRFEAVGEALVSGTETTAACAVVGRDVARDGASLGEALDGLRSTFSLVTGGVPDYASTRSLSVSWSEATLEYLHQLSCEDPLTGLASLAHVRTRLEELYRDADRTDVAVNSSHALVVVEMVRRPVLVGHEEHTFTRTLRLVQAGEAMRAVFSGGETFGRLALDRAVVVAERNVELGELVAMLRDLLENVDLGQVDTRVWIEGLPTSSDSAARLLDDLAR
jgi:GGDEF domain-containing protein